MFKVLKTNFYELSEPSSCKNALESYKEANDPVRQYWSEFEDQFVWDLIPYGFLYDLYTSWFKRNNPCGAVMGKNTFLKDLKNIVSKSTMFEAHDENVREAGRMRKTETLIYEYKLEAWSTPGFSFNSSATVEALCRPAVAGSKYKCLLRK